MTAVKRIAIFLFCLCPLFLFGQNRNYKDSIGSSQLRHEITFGITMFPSVFNNFGIQINKEKIPNHREGTILWLSTTREGHAFLPPVNFSYKKYVKENMKFEINITYYKVPSYYSFDKSISIPYLFLNTGMEKKLNKSKDFNLNLNYGLLFGYVNSQSYWGINNLRTYFLGSDVGMSVSIPLSEALFIQTNVNVSACAVNNRGKNFSDWDINGLFSKLFGLNIGFKF